MLSEDAVDVVTRLYLTILIVNKDDCKHFYSLVVRMLKAEARSDGLVRFVRIGDISTKNIYVKRYPTFLHKYFADDLQIFGFFTIKITEQKPFATTTPFSIVHLSVAHRREKHS